MWPAGVALPMWRNLKQIAPHRVVSNEIDGDKLEHTAPMCFEQLQCQLGQAIVPREALSNMKPPRGEVSRAWNLFTEFVSKSHGFRGSAISYADFTAP